MAEKKKESKNFINNKPLFSWKAPEFISYQKDKKWMLAVVLIGMVLSVILVTQKQWTGVGLIVVATLTILFLSNTKPKEVVCAVYNEGVVVDSKVYSFDQFKSFWMVNAELPKIQLNLNGTFTGEVSMPLMDVDIDQIRLLIGKYLPEEAERGEDAVDIINRLFRL